MWTSVQVTKGFRKLAICIPLLGVAFVTNAFGDIIGAPGFVTPGSGATGMWIGTYTGVPGYGTASYTVAQLIPSYYDYSALVLQVELQDDSQGAVDFALAPDDNGLPGTPIVNASVTLTSANDKGTIFTLPLQNATLQAGTRYWLTASSPTVLPWGGEYDVPVWYFSPGFGSFPHASSENGGPWTWNGNSFAYDLDGVADSQSYLSPGPGPSSDPPAVPEVSSAWLLLTVTAGLWLTLRRHRHY